MNAPGKALDLRASHDAIRVELDQAVATAKAYPRDLAAFKAEVLQIIDYDPSIAKSCHYCLERKDRDGNKVKIEGPSIRMAEIIAAGYGNTREGMRVVSEDGAFIVAQGIFHDIERNRQLQVEVRRRIANKEGRRYSDDMIQTTGAAAASIAYRNAVLKGIPKALWWPLYQRAIEKAKGTVADLPAARKEALRKAESLGADRKSIAAALGIAKPGDIDQEKLLQLLGMLQAIEEGAKVEEVFPPVTKPASNDAKKPEVAAAASVSTEEDDGAAEGDPPMEPADWAADIVQMADEAITVLVLDRCEQLRKEKLEPGSELDVLTAAEIQKNRERIAAESNPQR